MMNPMQSDQQPQGLQVEPLSRERLARAKAAYTTRHVAWLARTRRAGDPVPVSLLRGNVAPGSGDVVLARIDKLGQHKHIELIDGRRSRLFVGDEVVLCYGNRYAPDQFEAEVPPDLGPCQMVAAGGIAARVLSLHSTMDEATTLTPLGLLCDIKGRPVNLGDWALERVGTVERRPLTIAVVGTTMNSGKTTAASYLVKGLVRSGLKVGAAKITGTGAGGDVWFMRDAGADPVFDFTDAGFPTTYRATLEQTHAILTTLQGHLTKAGAEVIVIEVADGLYQDETSALLSSPLFAKSVDGLIFAAGDSMGAAAGAVWLRQRQLPVYTVTGMLTRSPLAMREAATVTDLPVVASDALADPAVLVTLKICTETPSGYALAQQPGQRMRSS